MRNAESLILTYAVNALWMTCAVAAVTAVLARGLRRISAAQQHVLWVVAMTLSVLLPMTSLRPATNSVMPPISRSHLTSRVDAPSFFHAANQRGSLPVTTTLMHVLLAVYGGLLTARLFGLAQGWRAIGRLTAGAQIRYGAVAAPFTVGIRRPIIILPRWLEKSSKERRAAIAHEIAHIRRHDFVLNAVYEILLVPLAFHPAAAFIKSRIDQTRELACDEIASARSSVAYAESLLNIARTILVGVPASAPRFAVALFDSDSLEKRILNLLDTRPRLRMRAALPLLAVTIALLGGASIAAASRPLHVASTAELDRFAGHWTAEFQGHRFFSMDLVRKGGTLTGKISRFSIQVNASGELIKAEEREGFTPIAEIRIDGSVLHIAGQDRSTTSNGPGDRIDLDLALIARGRGEIRIPDSPIKPWSVRRSAT